MLNTINLTKEERQNLKVSPETRQLIDLVYDGMHMEPYIYISKQGRVYFATITIYGDFDDYEDGYANATDKWLAISLAFENIYLQITMNDRFASLFPYSYFKLVKRNWFSERAMTESVSIVNEMKRAGIITNIEYDYKQDGNDDVGNPLWKCEAKYEFKKMLSDNETVTFISGPSRDKKSAKAVVSKALIWSLYTIYNLDQII